MKLAIGTLPAARAAAFVTLFVTGSAMAATPAELLKANNCFACHAVDTKIVGPAYKDVAAKYAGQKDAEAKLAEKVKKGGVGVWGQLPMPPNPQVRDADLAIMVKYILTLK